MRSLSAKSKKMVKRGSCESRSLSTVKCSTVNSGRARGTLLLSLLIKAVVRSREVVWGHTLRRWAEISFSHEKKKKAETLGKVSVVGGQEEKDLRSIWDIWSSSGWEADKSQLPFMLV